MNLKSQLAVALTVAVIPSGLCFVEEHGNINNIQPRLSPRSMLSMSSKESSSTERKPWEFFRFLRQSSKFVSPPFVGGRKEQKTIQPCQTLWQASDSNSVFTMAPLDDVVMGGASASTFDSNTGTWTGTVTDANNGGFVGIRSTPSFVWDCSRGCKGLEWKIKSNMSGTKRFKFVLRDSTDFNGITWSTSVDVKPGIQTIRIPFDRQIPAKFARRVPDQTFRKDNVVGVQIAYSKFEYDGGLNPKFSLGPVSLQLLELRAY
jgi:hypothetical protein